MSYKILNQDGEPLMVKGDDGKDHEAFGSAKSGVVKGIDRERRILQMIGTDESTDRDGDNILTAGWMLDNFRKNPVFLWSHNHGAPPMAAAKKLVRKRSPWRLEFMEGFMKEGIHVFADMVFELYGAKIMNASSVGFIPYEWDKKTKEEIEEEGLHPFVWDPRKFKKQELLELSAVSVPSNPNAVQSGDDKGAEVLASFSDDFEKMESFIKTKGFKDFETDPMKVLRFAEPLVFTDKVKERIDNEIGEMTYKGLEFEDELDSKVHQISENIVEDTISGQVVSIDEIKDIDPEIAKELERLFDKGLIGVSIDKTEFVELKSFDTQKVLESLRDLCKSIENSIKVLEDSETEDLDSDLNEDLADQETESLEEDKFGTMLWDQKPAEKIAPQTAPSTPDVEEAVKLLSKISDVAERLQRLRV